MLGNIDVYLKVFSLYTRVLPKWIRSSVHSGNMIDHCSMNWSQFKDPLYYLCLAGAVASWSLTQEVAVSNFFSKYNILSPNSVN